MNRPWIAPAAASLHDLPPTYRGLVIALGVADRAASALSRSHATGPSDPIARTALLCRAALDCASPADSRLTTALPALVEPPADSCDATDTRALNELLAHCIALAVDVLDNEEEPLTVDEVNGISGAVALLERAIAAGLGLLP